MTTIEDVINSKKKYSFFNKGDYGKDFPRLYTGIFVLDYCTAGIPVGVTTTFYGNPASSKCLKEDTLVFTDNGIVDLGHFKKGRPKGFSSLVETISGPTGDSVITSDFYIDETDKTVCIKNSLGMELEGTPSHRIRVLNKSAQFEMKPLSDIKEGDITCVCRNNVVFSKKNMALPEYTRTFPSYSDDIMLPDKFTPELARLFGYLVANGFNRGKSSLGISTKNMPVKADIDFICNKYGLKVGKPTKDNSFSIGGIKFRDIVQTCFDVERFPTARFKKVPNIILQSTKEVQLNFLQALFDCDAYFQYDINRDKGYLSYCTASEVLSKQVQMMLLSCNVISIRKSTYLEEYDHDYWYVNLTNSSTSMFLNMIDSVKYLGHEEIATKKSNIDVIPFFKEVLIEKLLNIKKIFNVNKAGTFYYNNDFLRFTPGHILNQHTDRRVTYVFLDKILEQLKVLPPIEEVQDIISLCKSFIATNYFYSPVERIEHKQEKTFVYDFNIPNEHLYLSNGYVSHNSTSALKLLGLAQKTCWNCFEFLWDCKCNNQKIKKSVVVSNEGFDIGRAAQLGCNIDELIVAEPATGEECVDIIYECLNAEDCGVLLLDSFSRVIPEAEIFNPALDNHMGKRAQLHTKLMNKVKSTLLLNKRKKIDTCFIAINQMRAKIGGGMFGQTEEMQGCYASKHDWHLSCRLGALSVKGDQIDTQSELPLVSKHSLSLVSPGIKRKVFTLAGKGEFLLALEDTAEYNIGDSCDHKTVIDYATNLNLLDKTGWKLFDTDYGKKVDMIARWQSDPEHYLTVKRRIIEFAADLKRGLIEPKENPNQK